MLIRCSTVERWVQRVRPGVARSFRARAVRSAMGMILLGVCLGACVDALDEEQSRIGEIRRDCVVPVPRGVSDWGAPISLEYADGSKWIWESVTLEDGTEQRNVTALVRTAEDA